MTPQQITDIKEIYQELQRILDNHNITEYELARAEQIYLKTAKVSVQLMEQGLKEHQSEK